MNIMKIAKCIVLTLIFSSCVVAHLPKESCEKITCELDYYNRVAQTIASRYGMSLLTVTREKSGNLETDFTRRGKPLTLEEARRETVILNEELLIAYNANREAMQGLPDNHWTERNITLSIINFMPDGHSVRFPSIGSTMIVRKNLFLVSYNEDRLNPLFESKESYVEALRKVVEEVPTPGSAWQVSPCLMEHLKRRLAEIEARGESPEVEGPQKTKFYEGYLITEGFF